MIALPVRQQAVPAPGQGGHRARPRLAGDRQGRLRGRHRAERQRQSTLLHLLGGMLSPTEGKVRSGMTRCTDLSSDERSAIRKSKIGFVFQTFNLVPYLTALENVQVPLVLAGLGEEGQKRRAEMLWRESAYPTRLDHKPRELSVGEQQRVALARMLAHDPIACPRRRADRCWTRKRRTALDRLSRANWTARGHTSHGDHRPRGWPAAPAKASPQSRARFKPNVPGLPQNHAINNAS